MIIFNIAYTLLGGIILYFTSNFWMGSQEDHHRAIEENMLEYVASRLLLNLFFVFILLLISFGLNLMVAKLSKSDVQMKRILIKEGIAFLAFSLVFVVASIIL